MTGRFELRNFGQCSFLPADCRGVFREDCIVFAKVAWRDEPIICAVYDNIGAAQAAVVDITNICKGTICFAEKEAKNAFDAQHEYRQPPGSEDDEFALRLAALRQAKKEIHENDNELDL